MRLAERPQFGEGEEISRSTKDSDSDTTNSQDSDEEGAVSLAYQQKSTAKANFDVLSVMKGFLNEFKHSSQGKNIYSFHRIIRSVTVLNVFNLQFQKAASNLMLPSHNNRQKMERYTDTPTTIAKDIELRIKKYHFIIH